MLTLTHWGRDKMAAISQTTFSNVFSWMKMYELRLKFHWSLFLRVQLTILQHWFRWLLRASQVTSHCLNQCWSVYRLIYASLDLNELNLICGFVAGNLLWNRSSFLWWGRNNAAELTYEGEIKWPPSTRRHCEMQFDEWKCINFYEDFTVPKCPINNIPISVQIMPWCHPGDKLLSEPDKNSPS